ncbi:MAG TPA: hypothetical protein VLA49_06860 [Anaerolineales bacterium]|nr:hypothetical protein [Anaerolineales bacterium]
MAAQDSWRARFARWLLRLSDSRSLAAVTAQVDDSPGWTSLTGRPHDYDQSKIQELYADALEAWRKNPIAWRIIAVTTDYVVGDKFLISSRHRDMQRFIDRFWNHPQNNFDMRLETMSDELARAGDLFVVLFRNTQDGLSYIRFVTKDRIEKIETAANDWERELVFYETQDIGEPKKWYSPDHPAAEKQDAIMLHYAVNRPMGALMGESDLTTMLPWLQRYSRMLEDRVRLNWALRAFLWFVTVPTTKVREKQEQYRTPPEAGSIVVKDESEQWEVQTPLLHSSDAQHDLKAVRQMIDAGSGYPPHWRGESADANLATATAMQAPTERHLLRRQKYFSFALQDVIFQAYKRARDLGKVRRISETDYEKLFSVTAPDISRSDNEALARAANDISQALASLSGQLAGKSETFSRLMLRLVYRFAGEPQADEILQEILDQVKENPITPPLQGGDKEGGKKP